MSDQQTAVPRSCLFTVRLWSEAMGSANPVLRGEVRHVLSGGVRYFQEWDTLVMFLIEQMAAVEQQQNGFLAKGEE